MYKGKPLFEGLNSKFVDFDKLFDDLEEKKITGFVEFVFKEKVKVLLYKEGSRIQGLSLENEKTVFDNKFFSDILNKKFERDAEINIYELPKGLLDAMLDIVNHDLVYENLDTAFIKFRKFLLKLSDSNHTGTIEFKMKKNTGYILMESGEPENVFFEDENLIFDGTEALEKIVDTVERDGALINVYKKFEP